MQTYVLRRMLLGLITVALVSVIIFVFLRVAPGDVALIVAMQGDDTIDPNMIDPLLLETIREELGLHYSLPEQYLRWMGGMLTLDWGTSFYTGAIVYEEFLKRAPVTLQLAISTITISVLLGIPAGVIMALRQDTWADYVVRLVSLVGLSIPSFWIGTLMIVVGMLYFEWSPRLEYIAPWDDFSANMSMFFFPAIATASVSMPTKARMMRSTMLEVLRQDYIRTAHAKGLRYLVVVWRHAVKNAMLPVITIIGIQIAFVVGGSVIMETIFQLPGMGTLLIRSMNQRDYEVVQSFVAVVSTWIVFTNLMVDLAYAWLDPRIRFD